jgi:hypothetical protein
MAARTRMLRLTPEWKEKIRVGVILDRLSKHVDGEVEMSSTQIKAAEILLKKVVPDVARTEVAGDEESPITVKVVTGI